MRPRPSAIRTTAAKVLAVALVACVGSFAARAQPVDPYRGQTEWNPVDSKIPALPPYCRASLRPQQYPGPSTGDYGCGVWINHFCPALVAINRARNPLLPLERRRYNLQLADDHLAYTRRHLAPSCRLAQELQLAESRAKLTHSFVK